jgi:hypothetical protein
MTVATSLLFHTIIPVFCYYFGDSSEPPKNQKIGGMNVYLPWRPNLAALVVAVHRSGRVANHGCTSTMPSWPLRCMRSLPFFSLIMWHHWDLCASPSSELPPPPRISGRLTLVTLHYVISTLVQNSLLVIEWNDRCWHGYAMPPIWRR